MARGETVRAFPVDARLRCITHAIEQRSASDRELGSPRVHPIVRVVGCEPDQRADRGVELDRRVRWIRGGLGDLREHRVGLGRGLATFERRAAQRSARVVYAAKRDERTCERELVLGDRE